MSYLKTSNLFPSPSTATTTSFADVSKDVELSNPAEDSISSLSWSSASNFLATSSWDKKVRVYNLNTTPSGEPMAMIDFEGPALSCHWSPDGSQVVGAGTDNTARLIDLKSNGGPARQIGGHNSAISSVRFFEGPSNAAVVVTGSWDKTVKYWDLRMSTPIATVDVKDKVYSMDTQRKQLIVATAGSKFCSINLENPTKISEYPTLANLKGETRVVRCFPDARGFIAGSAGGKGSVHWFGTQNATKGFGFKCHRQTDENKITNCYAVNAVAFHPTQGTFCTGGSDGSISVWDKDAKARIASFASVGTPISALAFSHNGDMLAYAIGYDWSKGFAYNTPQTANKIMIHPVSDGEVKAKSNR